MDKKKIIKILFIIVLVLIVLILINVTRNFIIIKKLQKNAEQHISSTNYHLKTIVTKDNEIVSTMNYYKKDNKIAMIMEKENNGEVTRMLTYVNEGKTNVFFESKGGKSVQLDTEAMLISNIYNCLETKNDFQTFMIAMKTIIRKSEYKGNDCYIMTGLLFPLSLNGAQASKVYVENETGLSLNSIIDSETTEREYEFDNVDDGIFVEPDISQYKIL